MAADHETKIRITGDSKSAISAVTAVTGALNRLRKGIGGIFRALGTFSFAIQGIKTIIDMVKTAGAWIDGIIHKAERLNAAYRDQIVAKALESSVSGYKKLNSEVERQIQLQKDLDAAFKNRRDATRDLNDAQFELQHQKDIAALDPGDKDYAKKRSAIDSAYANAQAERNASRGVLDAEHEQKSLEDELKRTKENIRKLEGKLRVLKNVKPLTDDKEKIKAFEAEEAKIKADLDKAIAARNQLKRLLKIAPKAVEAAKVKAESARLQSENSRQGIAAQDAAEAAREKEASEKAAEDAYRKAQEKARSSGEFERIQREELRRDKAEREKEAAQYLERVAGVSDAGRPTDRLTAMGLGSGAMRDPLAEKQAKDIATIAKEVVKIAQKPPASTTVETTYVP